MNPELFDFINGVKSSLGVIMEDLSLFNYGNARARLESLYVKLAVQSSLLNTNLDEMENSEPQVINCALSDEELDAEYAAAYELVPDCNRTINDGGCE